MVFVHTAQEAEIKDFVGEVIIDIVLKISFELEALGILVINICAGNIALIGASLIRNWDIFFVI